MLFRSYDTPGLEKQKRIVDTCRAVFQVIDTHGGIAEKLSPDSFLCGFKLVGQIFILLNDKLKIALDN